jgi:hypothetical protein
MKIAVVGLGNMGAAMAANLLKAGHDVAVWNRPPANTGRESRSPSPKTRDASRAPLSGRFLGQSRAHARGPVIVRSQQCGAGSLNDLAQLRFSYVVRQSKKFDEIQAKALETQLIGEHNGSRVSHRGSQAPTLRSLGESSSCCRKKTTIRVTLQTSYVWWSVPQRELVVL